MGEYDKAIADFGQSIQRDPGPTVYTASAASLAPYKPGPTAYSVLSKKENLFPKDDPGYFLYSETEEPNFERGMAYLDKGDYDQAIADYSEAIRLDPKDEMPCRYRGIAYAYKGDNEKAITSLSMAIQVEPANPEAYRNRGQVYAAKGDFLDAAADLNQAARLARSPSDCNALAWTLATSPQPALRDGKKAVAYATKACNLSRWHEPDYFTTLAAACAEAGDFKDAVKWQSAYLAQPHLTASDAGPGKTRLMLFQVHQPYHATLSRQ
jgi:tetratricopeptide (TPR) repeat protein